MAYLYTINNLTTIRSREIGNTYIGGKIIKPKDQQTYDEIESQLTFLVGYFKDNEYFIPNDEFNEYIQININLLCKKYNIFKTKFINILKKLPDELKDLYGYNDLI